VETKNAHKKNETITFEEMEIDKAIKLYLQQLKEEKKYASHTLTSYANDLNSFKEYCQQMYETKNISEIDLNIIRSHVALLKENGLAVKSINRKISSIRSLFNYLFDNELCEQNPGDLLKSLKKNKRLPTIITQQHNDRLTENYLEKELESNNYRIVLGASIYFMLYHTGLRASEIIELKMLDLDIKGSQIKVKGKGNKERIIPLTTEIKRILTMYYLPKRNEITTKEYVFVFENGKKIYHKWLYNKVRDQIGRVSTQEKRSPHILRHSFATHLLDEGAELNAIKELLGHANLSATELYAHNSMERLKKVYKNFHPKSIKKRE